MPLVKTIEDLFETNEDEVDSIDLDAICKPYVEENKEMRKKIMGWHLWEYEERDWKKFLEQKLGLRVH